MDPSRWGPRAPQGEAVEVSCFGAELTSGAGQDDCQRASRPQRNPPLISEAG